MDPTALPTDNLYKFLALAGLSLSGFCGWLIWRINTWALAEAYRLKEIALRHRARRRADRALRNISDAGPHNTTRSFIKRSFALQGETEVLLARADKMLFDLSSLKASLRTLKRLVWVGLLVSLMGFVFWYLRLQQYTDRQTKADFEDHMARCSSHRDGRALGFFSGFGVMSTTLART